MDLHPTLVMIDTFHVRLPSPGSQRGDTLVEVLISAFLVGLIVVGTFSGLNSSSRATALQRSRSQADALAEQDEDRLRSEPINLLAALGSHPQITTTTVGNTRFTIESSATYIADSTATESCSSSSPQANYLQTTSKVTWNGAGKPVEENGVISPPPGSNLIVQVTESGSPVQSATVTAVGPAPETTSHTLETSSRGCAIIALPSGGEYSINAHKVGYVDQNGYENTDEDETVTQKVYIAAENTAKEGYYLGRTGALEVNFSGGTEGQGETFVLFNSGMTTFNRFPKHASSYAVLGTEGAYASTVTTNGFYPFTTDYTIYAGTCEADKPPTLGSENEVLIPPGGTGHASLLLPSLRLKVYSGANSSSSLVNEASGSVTDTGCGVKRAFVTNASGATEHPALPYGTYNLCVTAKVGSPAKQRRFEKKEIHITTASGASENVYLGSAPESSTPC
jgi:Tfp pilus assembly protein PilV